MITLEFSDESWQALQITNSQISEEIVQAGKKLKKQHWERPSAFVLEPPSFGLEKMCWNERWPSIFGDLSRESDAHECN